MLVVSRYPDQAIRIGDNVTVKVIRVGERRVMVGVDAPHYVPVRREEMLTPDAGGADSGEKLRVLVVEDDPSHATLIEETLTKCKDFDIVIVANGEDAIRLLQLGDQHNGLNPDLILLNLHPPDVSGLDVLDYVRLTARQRTTPVVMLGNPDADVDVIRCLEKGANAFVLKCAQQHAFRQTIYSLAEFWRHCCKVGRERRNLALAGHPAETAFAAHP